MPGMFYGLLKSLLLYLEDAQTISSSKLQFALSTIAYSKNRNTIANFSTLGGGMCYHHIREQIAYGNIVL